MFHMIFPNLQLYLSISRATKYWLNLMNKTKKRTKIDVMLDFTQWYQKLSIWKYGQSVDSVSLNVGDAPRRQSCEFPLGPASVMELGGLTSSVEFCPSPSQHLRQHSLTTYQHLPYSHVTDKCRSLTLSLSLTTTKYILRSERHRPYSLLYTMCRARWLHHQHWFY